MVNRYFAYEEEYNQLKTRIEELKQVSRQTGIELDIELEQLESKLEAIRTARYSNLSCWEKVLLCRHPERPTALDYIDSLCSEWMELHGDRLFGDDPALVGGIGIIDGRAVTVLGHQKGRDTKDNLYRNFGMPHPEGYRKAERLVHQAEKFGRPLLTLVNTPGAYPGIGAEERGQGWAIASMLMLLSRVPVPVISVVTGEGGSGGALALALADRLIMLSNSVFSVASPEACSSILWRDPGKVEEVAADMKITAQDLQELGIVDEIIPEPAGGVQQSFPQVATALRETITRYLSELETSSPRDLVEKRYRKLRKIGVFVEN